jgi:hypothetical protein
MEYNWLILIHFIALADMCPGISRQLNFIKFRLEFAMAILYFNFPKCQSLFRKKIIFIELKCWEVKILNDRTI